MRSHQKLNVWQEAMAVVKDIYKIAKRLEKTHKIIIIGDKGHDEVKGIAGQLKKKPITIEAPYNPVNKSGGSLSLTPPISRPGNLFRISAAMIS